MLTLGINYRTEDFVARTRELTDGRGADVVLDIMGASYLGRNIEAVALDGRVVVIGMQGGTHADTRSRRHDAPPHLADLDCPSLAPRSARRPPSWPRSPPTSFRRSPPVGCRRWSIACCLSTDAAEAHRLIEAGEVVGKVVLDASRVPDTDVWATWLRTGRDGGSAAMRAENLRRLEAVRDLILDRAGILPGDTVLDVGTGQGLLGLAALARNGPEGRVVFSDVSAPVLDDCRIEVERLSAVDRSSFIRASATDLSAIDTGSVDVVVERAVLLFIEDRARAFAEYHRVLRAGGRLSLAEPLNSWMSADRPGYLWGYDVTEVTELERKLRDAESTGGRANRRPPLRIRRPRPCRDGPRRGIRARRGADRTGARAATGSRRS